MSYNRGFLKDRAAIWNPDKVDDGYSKRVAFVKKKQIYCNFDYTHGKRAMNNGQLDIYNAYMVRCDVHSELKPNSRLEHDGRYFIIDSYNVDRQKNECQLTCFEIDDINAKVQTQGQGA